MRTKSVRGGFAQHNPNTHHRVRASDSEAIVHGPPSCGGHLRASNWAALGGNNPNERSETLTALRQTACTKLSPFAHPCDGVQFFCNREAAGNVTAGEHLEDRILRAAGSWPRRGTACLSVNVGDKKRVPLVAVAWRPFFQFSCPTAYLVV